MSDTEREELQNPDNWEWDDPQQIVVPKEHRRTVVSVSLRRDQSKVITEAAERAGEKVSEFIRNAAIERAKGGRQLQVIRVSTSDIQLTGVSTVMRLMKSRSRARIMDASLS